MGILVTVILAVSVGVSLSLLYMMASDDSPNIQCLTDEEDHGIDIIDPVDRAYYQAIWASESSTVNFSHTH